MKYSIRAICIAVLLTCGYGSLAAAQAPETGGGGGTSSGGGDKLKSGKDEGPETGGGGGKLTSAPKAKRASANEKLAEKSAAKPAAKADAKGR